MRTTVVFILSIFFSQILISQTFTEVASSININASYGPGQFGGGVSFADFDQDGWDDLTFSSGAGQPLYFFRNVNGTYVQANFEIYNIEQTKQVLWVDFDNDGDKDFFYTTVNGYNRLYSNDGNMNMTDITASAGLLLEPGADSFGACFGDYNNDGWLDLYVSNRQYFFDDPTNFLYRNNGDGTFTDVSGVSGTHNGIKPTFAPVFFDANQNGYQDLFLAQDRLSFENDLYENNGDGTFSNVSSSAGVNHLIDGMNAGIGDFDNDLDLDIYVTNTPGGNLLLQNDGTGVFNDVATASGVTANHIGWGANFLDAENDGDLDLYVSCSTQNGQESNRFYLNSGNGTFTENGTGLPGDLLSSYGNAVGDINNDGRLDIAVSNSSPNHFVWRNDNVSANNWLKIDLVGTTSNADGIGSWVEVTAGNDTYLRYKHCGESYLAQNTNYLHFGLDDHEVIDEIKVNWLSGHQTILTNINSNQRIVINEDNVPLALEILDFNLSAIEENAFIFTWNLQGKNDNEKLTIQKSTTGFDFEDILLDINSSTYRDWDVQKSQQYYYRLKVVDTSGNVTYSDIVIATLDVSSSILNVSIFPNPTESHLNFSVHALSNGKANCKILNNLGQEIKLLFDQSINLGINNFEVDIKRLHPNQYFLQIEFNGEVIIRPFTKI